MHTKNTFLSLMIAIGSLAANAAQAHAKIEAAEPKADSELAAAPKEISLHFNEKLEPAFSKIALLDAKNAAIALPKAAIDKTDGKTMSAPLPALSTGQYLVRWSAMTHDGHKVKGEYRFKVK
ncbi:copper homeostasis periplasmic binding protein CopC [Massilia sp. B-10]|nr:copper homeostasis periplasmic binding protein CopC [Massilia sp. B-10]